MKELKKVEDAYLKLIYLFDCDSLVATLLVVLKIMVAQPNIIWGDRIRMLSVSCLTSPLSRSYPAVGEYKGGRHEMETSSLKKNIQGTGGKRAMNPIPEAIPTPCSG